VVRSGADNALDHLLDDQLLLEGHGHGGVDDAATALLLYQTTQQRQQQLATHKPAMIGGEQVAINV